MGTAIRKDKITRMDTTILDVREAASLFRVSIYTIYRLISKSKLPATKVGKQWRLHRHSLIKWLAYDSNTSQIERMLKSASIKKK